MPKRHEYLNLAKNKRFSVLKFWDTSLVNHKKCTKEQSNSGKLLKKRFDEKTAEVVFFCRIRQKTFYNKTPKKFFKQKCYLQSSFHNNDNGNP